ncbi:MAG: rhomboid family intramembrane serine protease [Litoreibacter sp.]
MPLKWRIAIAALMGALFLPEFILQLADMEILGTPELRFSVYSYGAFWPGLIASDWTSNYALQPILMFFTYSFLHNGIPHLLGNLIALVWTARRAPRYVSLRDFLILYAAGVACGALAHVVITLTMRPVIGASGGMYCLITAWVFWIHLDTANRLTRIMRIGAGLIALLSLNALSWWLSGGNLAWQAHVGGMVAGGMGVWALKYIQRAR